MISLPPPRTSAYTEQQNPERTKRKGKAADDCLYWRALSRLIQEICEHPVVRGILSLHSDHDIAPRRGRRRTWSAIPSTEQKKGAKKQQNSVMKQRKRQKMQFKKTQPKNMGKTRIRQMSVIRSNGFTLRASWVAILVEKFQILGFKNVFVQKN